MPDDNLFPDVGGTAHTRTAVRNRETQTERDGGSGGNALLLRLGLALVDSAFVIHSKYDWVTHTMISRLPKLTHPLIYRFDTLEGQVEVRSLVLCMKSSLYSSSRF